MNIEELEARAAEIDGMNRDGLSTEEIEHLAEEREGIVRQLAEIRLQAAQDAKKRARAAGDPNARVITKAPKENKKEEQRMYTKDSPEYRTAFLKMMQSTKADASDAELTAEERDAYTTVTTDSTNHPGYLVPTQIANRIWDLVADQHSIVGDIDMYRDTGCVMEFVKRTSISQGDATTVNEAAANDDEKNVFGKITLDGKDFSKHVDVSYAMAKMAIPAFENFLVTELADRIGAALASDIVTQIGTDYDSTYNAMNSSSVKAVSFKDVATIMSMLGNGDGQCMFYGKRETIYAYLVGMVDTTGRPIFQPDAQGARAGYLIGCPVKVEEAVAANKILVGFPTQVKGNMIQDITIESARDIKKHVITYAGDARFECGLIAPDAFAILTVKQS